MDFGPVFEKDLERCQAMPLGTEPLGISAQIDFPSLSLEKAFSGVKIANQSAAKACLSGYYLLFNALDRSHSISQKLDTAEGSFWHAIMHRREGDYWNSKYWFKQFSHHPIYNDLLAGAQLVISSEKSGKLKKILSSRSWDAGLYVDLVEECCAKDSSLAGKCQQIQALEWQLLFSYCFNLAITNSRKNI